MSMIFFSCYQVIYNPTGVLLVLIWINISSIFLLIHSVTFLFFWKQGGKHATTWGHHVYALMVSKTFLFLGVTRSHFGYVKHILPTWDPHPRWKKWFRKLFQFYWIISSPLISQRDLPTLILFLKQRFCHYSFRREIFSGENPLDFSFRSNFFPLVLLVRVYYPRLCRVSQPQSLLICYIPQSSPFSLFLLEWFFLFCSF